MIAVMIPNARSETLMPIMQGKIRPDSIVYTDGFSAYDALTGELVWRFYTVPASHEGPHEHPELEMAAATWSKDSM